MSGPREFELKLEFEPDKVEIIRRHLAVALKGNLLFDEIGGHIFG